MELMQSVVAGSKEHWGLVLFGLVLIYTIIIVIVHGWHLRSFGREFCLENGHEFIEVKSAKAHYSIVYKTLESGRRKYKRFRMRTTLLGKRRFVEWVK